MAGVLCSLLACCGETTNNAQPYMLLSAETCKVEPDPWFLYFYRMLECEFAEMEGFEDVGVARPDCARRTPALIISSPDNPRRQDCYIVIAQTTRWLEASFWLCSVACCLFIVWSWICRHRGHLLALSFSEDRGASEMKWKIILIHLLWLLARRGGWTQMLFVQLYNLVTGHDTQACSSLAIYPLEHVIWPGYVTYYITLAWCYIQPGNNLHHYMAFAKTPNDF